MTEKKGKRRYWRRRPRRKEGGQAEGGEQSGRPEELPGAESEGAAEPMPAGMVPVSPPDGTEAPPADAEPVPPAQGIEAASEADRAGVSGQDAGEPEHPEGPAGEQRKGRRRSRRRGSRRRRGKGAQPVPEADAAGVVAPVPEEFKGGAEGTSSEEARAELDAEEGPEPEAEAEEEEEEAAAEPGKGPRKVMLIDGIHPEEIRVAIVSDGNLDYFEVENQRRKQFKGNIYKGKVVNVAHAIEAAFVEFGGGRHGFLPLNEYCGGALIENLGTWNEGDKRPHLRPGTEILVQVTKEESSIKGAALTSYISIAGRYLVMMLGMKRYGISKKITGEKDRERIRKNMEKLEYPEHLGFIVRTVGAGQPLKDLKADLENLLKLWNRTVEGARTQKAPALLYEEQDIVIRTLRDNYSSDVSEVLMNSADSFRKAQAFFDVYYPKQKAKLKLYRQKKPLFGKFNLEEQLERACARKVALPSGGHIVIDRTEAMWSIDVNSGRSSKDRDIEDTAFRTNKEAASEVAKQLRIRDMGGLIVVDFIDMENRGHIKDVEKTLKDALKRDKAKSDVSVMGKFGLVAVSRQRMGISFYDILLKGCDLCAGTGSLPTMDSLAVRLLRRVHVELSRDNARDIVVRVSPALLEGLLNQKREEITAMEKLCGARVVFASDPALAVGAFSIEEGAP